MYANQIARATAVVLAAMAALLAGTPVAAQAQESHAITIRNGKFEPSTVNVKAGVKVQLTITNSGTKAVEFESSELNREKIIPAGGSGSVYIGPLSPGSYPFFDDFDQSNRGRIVAK